MKYYNHKILFGFIVLSLSVGCAKKNEYVSSEAVRRVLSQSAFNEGETIPPTEEFSLLSTPVSSGLTTDSGFIAPPSNSISNGGNDTGSILPPSSSDPVGNDGGLISVVDTVDENAISVDDVGQIVNNDTPSTSPSTEDSGQIVNNDTPSTSPSTEDSGQIVNNDTSVPDTSDSGQVTNNDTPSTQPPVTGTQFKFKLRRVCSIERSKSSSLFFEDAKNPILTIESVQSKSKTGNKTNTKTTGNYTSRLVTSISLKDVDLQKGPFRGQGPLGMEAFKKQMGLAWRIPYLTVRVCEDSNSDGYCFDESKKNQLAFEVPQFKAPGFPKSIQLDVWSGRYLSFKQNPGSCETQYSPLVFDLKGDGLNLIGPDSGVQFDLDDVGYPIRTGWISDTDDALLVRDLTGNGRIDSGAELFGSATRLPSGERAINGFEALRALDSDRDGYITSRDVYWNDLRLWIDSNQDGVSQRKELITLDRAGVESINLDYFHILEIDTHGNQTRERSTFIRRVRNKRYVLPVSDVWFNTY